MKKKLEVQKEKYLDKIFITTYIFLFIWLLFKNIGPYAYVFGDETTYSKFSRLLPFSEADIPCYLYFWVYKLTSFCGDAFLIGARVLNTVFFIGSGLFIYKIARNFSSKIAANILVVVVLVSPLNIYTAYFMPESLYMFCFWVFSWYLLDIDNKDIISKWSISGVLFGILTLIKPHALFFLPAIILYYAFLLKQDSSFFRIKSWLNLFILLISCFFVKFGISYILAGNSGLTLLGPLYQGIGTSAAGGQASYYLSMLMNSFSIFKGHLLVILIIYGVPIFAIIFNIVSGNFNTNSRYLLKLLFYTGLVLSNLILVTILFSSIASVKLGEDVYRIHMRYYSFALPLVYICFLAVSEFKNNSLSKLKIIPAIVLLILLICVLSPDLFSFKPNFVDCPEFASIYSNDKYLPVHKYLFVAICVSSVALIFFSIYKCSITSKFFIFFFLPFLSLLSIYNINRHQNNLKIPNNYIRAGIFAKYNLDEIEKKNLLLVGDIKEHLLHAKLIVDSPNASIQVIKPDEKYFQIDTKYANIENILVIGPHSIVSDKYNVINLNGFKFVKKINGISLDFRSPFNPFIISNISGISASEAWGAWSIGEEVEIEFASNLPSSFKLKMTAKAFNNNVGKDIIVQVGDVLKAIQLSDHLSDVSLDFHDLKPVNEIKILVPAPTSPHEIGMNADERKIGIGFLSLSIEPSK